MIWAIFVALCLFSVVRWAFWAVVEAVALMDAPKDGGKQ